MRRLCTLSLLLILCLVLSPLPLVSAAEDSWTTLEPMPTARSGLGVAAVDGKIYAIVSGINYEYDPATDSWTAKTPHNTREIGASKSGRLPELSSSQFRRLLQQKLWMKTVDNCWVWVVKF